MARMRLIVRVLIVVVLATSSALALSGCTEPEPEEVALVPEIEPPLIGEAGKLRAGVDLEYPPFGGSDRDQQAGIDVDIAAALAAELGLELEIVDTKPEDAAQALADGEIDIAMSVPFTEESMGSMSLAGAYTENGPAFFVSVEDTSTDLQELTISSVAGMSIAAQEGASAFWTLDYELGEGAVESYPTLREALEALDAGEVEVVAGDAFVGAYIGRDLGTVTFAGQVRPAVAVGIGVATDATELEASVRETLDALASSGVLDTVRAKWVGDLPELETSPGQ